MTERARFGFVRAAAVALLVGLVVNMLVAWAIALWMPHPWPLPWPPPQTSKSATEEAFDAAMFKGPGNRPLVSGEASYAAVGSYTCHPYDERTNVLMMRSGMPVGYEQIRLERLDSSIGDINFRRAAHPLDEVPSWIPVPPETAFTPYNRTIPTTYVELAGFPWFALASIHHDTQYIGRSVPPSTTTLEFGVEVPRLQLSQTENNIRVFYIGSMPRTIPLRPLWPGFVLNSVFYAGCFYLLTLVVSSCAHPLLVARRRRRGVCVKHGCGYRVRTEQGELAVCPECGTPQRPAPRRRPPIKPPPVVQHRPGQRPDDDA